MLRSIGQFQNRVLQHSKYFQRTFAGEVSSKVPKKSKVREVNADMTVESAIHKKLTETFNPQHLEVINESYMHNVPAGSETHFKVVIVSDKFENLTLIKKHRWVNETLQELLQFGVHALSIMAKTPKEWESSDQKVEKSPPCRGGFGK